MNLETHKIIDLNSRDPKIIQAYLNQFSNLELISRDRGHQYSVLCPSLIHVADRFHLIMNLTTIIINYVRNQMKLINDDGTTDMPNIELNIGQKTKQLLVNDVRTDYAKCKNMALVAQKYNLSWITVRKYLSPNFDVVSKRRTTGDTKLSPYIKEIETYYKSGKMCTEIYQMISRKYGFAPFAYRTLCDYIKKTYKQEAIKIRKSKQMNKPDFIKYLFNWHPDLNQKKPFEKALLNDLILNECIQFFNKFSAALTHQNRELCQELLAYEADSKILAQFIRTLNKDSAAILNAATYCYNNGLAEGTVNKIKVIKRIMFGRASFNLLRIKVLNFT